MKKTPLILIVSFVALLQTGLLAAYATEQPLPAGPMLAMMGGSGGGHMMGGQGNGYRQPGGSMGDSRGQGHDQDRFSGGTGFNEQRNAYRNSEYQDLKDELHLERRELSKMIRGKTADPEEINRKMERVEQLERRMDDIR